MVVPHWKESFKCYPDHRCELKTRRSLCGTPAEQNLGILRLSQGSSQQSLDLRQTFGCAPSSDTDCHRQGGSRTGRSGTVSRQGLGPRKVCIVVRLLFYLHILFLVRPTLLRFRTFFLVLCAASVVGSVLARVNCCIFAQAAFSGSGCELDE